MLILMECVLDLVTLDLFVVVDRLLQVYQFFLIAHQQVYTYIYIYIYTYILIYNIYIYIIYIYYIRNMGWEGGN